MEQFSPSTSKIFAAASFVNLYSSIFVVAIRVLVTISLVILLIITATSNDFQIFYLILSVSIIFFVFEIYYRERVLKEAPQPLEKGQVNLADSFSLGAARLVLSTGNLNDSASLMGSLLSNNKVLFALNKADVTAQEVTKLLNATKNTRRQIDFGVIVAAARNWSIKEGRRFIDKLDILLALINQ
ncbi:hypothetical protein IH981_03845, partial [Patescibacteria group bacterium]|nr:hypothetical protein [Patescibacteria group bacterium]